MAPGSCVYGLISRGISTSTTLLRQKTAYVTSYKWLLDVHKSRRRARYPWIPREPPTSCIINGKVIEMPEMRVEFVVPPDLDKCELKPYVAWRASVVEEPELTAESLFEIRYAEQTVPNIPRLHIPSESNSSSDIEEAEAVIENADVEIETKVEVSKQRESDCFEWQPQTLNPEQASLSWSFDALSKESNQLTLGWTSQINNELMNDFEIGKSRVAKQANYSPLVVSDIPKPTSPVYGTKMELIVEHVPPKPKDRKNFIRKNVNEVRAKRAPKNGSYSHLMTARLQPSVGSPSNIESITFSNLPVCTSDQSTIPTAKLEHLLQEQRMDLIQAVDDFLRESSQETTSRLVSPNEIEYKPFSQPKIQRRPVKVMNFKDLDMYAKEGAKHEQSKDMDDLLNSSWRHEFSSLVHEVTSLKPPKSSEISIPLEVITPSVEEKPKPFSNFKKFKIAQSQGIPEKAKSKREIVVTLSRWVNHIA
nr:mitochondrial 50S ribosomal protein L41 [Hymenolepis microstoma]